MINKRQKFIITTSLLTIGFVSISLLDENRFLGIGVLAIAAVALFAWSLWEGLRLNATLLTLVLPALYTLGVGLFWFLLPSSMFARVPVLFIYAMGIYSMSLTKNIYTVSIVRTIALSRAAKSVGFVLTLFTLFLLFDVILSFRAPVYLSALAIAFVSFPAFTQGLWSGKLQPQFSKELIIYSFVFTFCLSTIYILLSFWPVTVATGSIFLTSICYVLLGMGQSKFEGRLFKQTIREYLLVGTLIFVTMLLVTSWR